MWKKAIYKIYNNKNYHYYRKKSMPGSGKLFYFTNAYSYGLFETGFMVIARRKKYNSIEMIHCTDKFMRFIQRHTVRPTVRLI